MTDTKRELSLADLNQIEYDWIERGVFDARLHLDRLLYTVRVREARDAVRAYRIDGVEL